MGDVGLSEDNANLLRAGLDVFPVASTDWRGEENAEVLRAGLDVLSVE